MFKTYEHLDNSKKSLFKIIVWSVVLLGVISGSIYLLINSNIYLSKYATLSQLTDVKQDNESSINESFELISIETGIDKDDLISYYALRYPESDVPDYNYYADDFNAMVKNDKEVDYVDFLFELVFAFDIKICESSFSSDWINMCTIDTTSAKTLNEIYPSGSLKSKIVSVSNILNSLNTDYDLLSHLESKSRLDTELVNLMIDVIQDDGVVSSKVAIAKTISQVISVAYNNEIVGSQNQYQEIKRHYNSAEDVLSYLNNAYQEIYKEESKYSEDISTANETPDVEPLNTEVEPKEVDEVSTPDSSSSNNATVPEAEPTTDYLISDPNDGINIYVKNFSGSTDVDQIKSAINAANSGQVIILENKTYNINQQITLKSNMTLKGSGDNTILNLTYDGIAISLGSPNTTVSNLTLKNFKITTSVTSSNHSYYGIINSDGATLNSILIDGVTINTPSLHRNNIFIKSLDSYQIDNITIQNCKLLGAGRMNLEITAFDEASDIQARNIKIYNNYFTNAGKYSEPIGSSVVGKVKNVEYKGNTFDTNSVSIEVGGGGLHVGGGIYIRDNIFTGTSDRIVMGTSKSPYLVKDFVFENNKGDSVNNGDLWLRGIGSGVISNNNMTLERVEILNDSTGVIVEDNVFRTTSSSSITCEESSDSCIVRNNDIFFEGDSVYGVLLAVSNNHSFYNNKIYYRPGTDKIFINKGLNNTFSNNTVITSW